MASSSSSPSGEASASPSILSSPGIRRCRRSSASPASAPSGRRNRRAAQVADRADWYDYVARAEHPTIVVIQDIDDTPGYGAFWGEVNSALHKALGARGCVTNGSFRDVTAWAEGFQMLGGRIGPSHAHVHVVDFGKPVNVFGMLAGHDDVIHADRHGAVVVPAEAVTKLPAAIALIERRERVILDACRGPSFSAKDLREIMKRSREIH